MNDLNSRGISRAVRSLRDSVTHGTTAKITELNRGLAEADRVIDLSIGALDLPTDPRIDRGVIEFVQTRSEAIHAFAPIKGFPFLLEAIAARVARLHGISYRPETEILVTPGGVKGSISAVFHTLLDPGDEVVIPVPNWPHYADMARLHEAVPRLVLVTARDGLTAAMLERAISERTKLVILGDCINPTGKVYSTEELSALGRVIAQHNLARAARGGDPIYVLFDCPYEAHILDSRATTFAALEVALADGTCCAMRPWTASVTGPGKTYGMHGDRIGYLCAPRDLVEAAARAQVNLTSFASTYGQVATYLALQPEMDEVAVSRARSARASLDRMLQELAAVRSLHVEPPPGGYFLFIDFSAFADAYARHGYQRADHFLLGEARVATLCGSHFAEGDALDHFVRINCGRTVELVSQAGRRIQRALARLVS
jgi:aspartate/methionine/tyrosine aminotransferase